MGIDTNTNQEWMVIKYGNNKSKKMQRFCEDLQIIRPEEEDNKYNAEKDDSDLSDLETETTSLSTNKSIQSANSPVSQSSEHYLKIFDSLAIHKGHAHSGGKSTEYLPKEIATAPNMDNSVLETMGPILLE